MYVYKIYIYEKMLIEQIEGARNVFQQAQIFAGTPTQCIYKDLYINIYVYVYKVYSSVTHPVQL